MAGKKILLWGESLAGLGHLEILRNVASAFKANGDQVYIASGSTHRQPHYFADFNLVKLEPVSLDSSGGSPIYVDAKGTALAQSKVGNRRKEQLLAAYRRIKPDIVITEQWPLSRGVFDAELIPLMLEIHKKGPRPYVAGLSLDVRSANSRGALTGEPAGAMQVLENFYDRLYALSDESIIHLGDSFAPLHSNSEFTDSPLLNHAGFITPPIPQRTAMDEQKREVLVSAGGAPFKEALELFHASMTAKAHSPFSNRTWRILVSPAFSDADFAALAKHAGEIGGIVVERNRPDFYQLLTDCCLSISLAGYATLLGTLEAKVPSVVYAAQPEGFTDHTVRQRKFAEKGLIATIDHNTISNPKAFGKAIADIAEAFHKREAKEERPHKGVYPGADFLGIRDSTQFMLTMADDRDRAQMGYPPHRIIPRTKGAKQLVWLIENDIAMREPYGKIAWNPIERKPDMTTLLKEKGFNPKQSASPAPGHDLRAPMSSDLDSPTLEVITQQMFTLGSYAQGCLNERMEAIAGEKNPRNRLLAAELKAMTLRERTDTITDRLDGIMFKNARAVAAARHMGIPSMLESARSQFDAALASLKPWDEKYRMQPSLQSFMKELRTLAEADHVINARESYEGLLRKPGAPSQRR